MSGVQMGPGATPFTLIFLAARDCESARVNDTPPWSRVVEQVVTASIGGHR